LVEKQIVCKLSGLGKDIATKEWALVLYGVDQPHLCITDGFKFVDLPASIKANIILLCSNKKITHVQA